jgi:hypothetical protein
LISLALCAWLGGADRLSPPLHKAVRFVGLAVAVDDRKLIGNRRGSHD